MTIRAVRLQLSRAKGFNLQALSRATNGLPARNVTRSGNWGNPFPVDLIRDGLKRSLSWGFVDCAPKDSFWRAIMLPTAKDRSAFARFDEFIGPDFAAEISVRLFRIALERFQSADPEGFENWIAPLRGHNHACTCSLDAQWCHANVTLEIANR